MSQKDAPRAWGIILVGGQHWDARGIDRVLPRPLLPFGDAPLVSRLLRWLRRAGVSDATLCATGYSRCLRRLLGGQSACGTNLHYYEDWTPRGPAGCARDAGERAAGDTLLLCEGSVLPRFPAIEALRAHHASGAALTVVAQPDDELDDPCGGAAQAPEPPPLPAACDRLMPAGLYVLSRRALRHIPALGYQDIKEMLIPALHRGGERVGVFIPENASPRITDAESYLAAHERLLDELDQDAALGGSFRRQGSAWLHPTADVGRARLIGPVLIGPETAIADNAVVIGPTSIGAACAVGPHAVVSRSVLWDGARVSRWAVVDRCTVAHGAEVAEHAQLYGRVHLPDANSGPLLARLLGLRTNGASTGRGEPAADRDRAARRICAPAGARAGGRVKRPRRVRRG